MNAGEPEVSLEPPGNHSSPPPFCRDGFMTPSELPAWSSQPILTQRPVEGRFANQRYRSDQSPLTSVEFLSGRRGYRSNQPIHEEEP